MRVWTLVVLVCLFAALPLGASVGGGATIGAADTGYTPPVAVISSGESVRWQALDHGHVTVDTRFLGGDPCFFNPNEVALPSEPVRFDLVGGALTATSYGETLVCHSAVVTPASAVLSYHCELHPFMRGALVVTGSL